MLEKAGGVEESTCLLVAIDSGVSRRPPGMKVEHDRRVYAKTIELLLHDEETAANLLREISFGYMGPPFENEPTGTTLEDINHQKVTKAFQRGLIVGIRDMQILRMFLVKLYRTLDHLLRQFMAYASSQSDMTKKEESSPSPSAERPPSPGLGEGPSTSPQVVKKPSLKVKISTETEVLNSSIEGQSSSVQNTQDSKPPGSPLGNNSEHQESPLRLPSGSESTPNRVKSPRFPTLKVSPSSSLRRSPGSSPRLSSPNRISPLRENWHGKGSPGRMTLKLKDVSKTAKVCFSLPVLRTKECVLFMGMYIYVTFATNNFTHFSFFLTRLIVN